MSRQSSVRAYQRMLELYNMAEGDKEHNWASDYYLGKRRARFYADESQSFRVIKLDHGGLFLEVKMNSVPPDDANLEFANTIMDAAEHILMKGTVRK